MMFNDKNFEDIDLAKAGVITKLYHILYSDNEMSKLSINDIFSYFTKRKDIASILVGLWSFEFLKHPFVVNNGYRIYDYIEENQTQDIVDGLLNVIRYSHIEMREDSDAIDFAYSACTKLYYFLGDKSEDELVKQVISNPTVSLIDSLGVLVGHEVKGSITKDTFLLLKNIAESGQEPFATAASRVLIEDVERMNTISHFLSDLS